MTLETRKFSYTYCCKSLNFSSFKFKSGKMAKSIISNLKEEKQFKNQTKSEKERMVCDEEYPRLRGKYAI